MIELAGPLHLLAVVLVVSAVGKLVDPWPSTEAMRDAGLPVPFRGRPYGGVLLGLVEAIGAGYLGQVTGGVLGSHYADIFAARDRAGLPISMADAQIAAICRSNDAVCATRNVKDFVGTGVELVDPWG